MRTVQSTDVTDYCNPTTQAVDSCLSPQYRTKQHEPAMEDPMELPPPQKKTIQETQFVAYWILIFRHL